MSPRRPRERDRSKRTPPILSLSADDWQQVKDTLGFSPQQARVVQLMLEGKQDKQIAREMGLRVPTIRTHLSRIFMRTGSNDRVELLLRVFQCVYVKRVHRKHR